MEQTNVLHQNMRTSKIIYVFVFSVLTMCVSGKDRVETEVRVPGMWKFMTGDNTDYLKTDYDDETWKTINVEEVWESQGYPDYDGIAWYRTKIVIPASLKESNEKHKFMILQLGKIDDSDDTYFNGVHIGGKASWYLYRSYFIPTELIKWGEENVLAVRVNDINGNGGMYGGRVRIVDFRLENALSLKTTDKPLEFTENCGGDFVSKLFFDFNVPMERLEGTLSVKVYDPVNNDVAFQQVTDIAVGDKGDTSYSVNIPIKTPRTYKIEYCFYTQSIEDTLRHNTLFSYMPALRTNERFEHPVVSNIIQDKVVPFGLEYIELAGYLKERVDANLLQRLLNIDETGILECYYNRPGKQTWVGEYVGKYLHAASLVWRSTKNTQLKNQMDRIVEILISCQKEDGYLGTYLPVSYWTEWDVWAHKYNMIGLLSYYSITGYVPALEASRKMGDLLCSTFGEKDGQLNILNSSAHVGMASTSVLEPMTYLYRYTADKKYLDFCNYIIKAYEYDNGPKIISTLNSIGKVDKTANAKAYEMMSNLTGIVKLYQLTGDKELLKAAENAWNDVAINKLYVTGTASNKELFSEDFVLPAGNEDHMGEGCVTTTWLQFSQALYYLTGEAKYLDEIEKTIYNHLLAAENPQTGCVSYYTALQGEKPYRCDIHGHCCLASVPRGIAAIPELVYTKSNVNGCSINLYSSGSINDSLKTSSATLIPVNILINSRFPESGVAQILVTIPEPAEFNMALRVPSWSRNYVAKVGGKVYKGVPGQYLNISRVWKRNSKIEVSMNLNVHKLDGGISYPDYTSIKTGPQILAFDQALNPSIRYPDKIVLNSYKPVSLSKSLLPGGWVGSQIYSVKAEYEGKPVYLNLVPFADAGQTGGEVRVWMPDTTSLKKNTDFN